MEVKSVIREQRCSTADIQNSQPLFQTLSELERRKGDDNEAAEDDPARLQELRGHLLRLGAAESKVWQHCFDHNS